MSSYNLVNSSGQRKYLTIEERKRFIANTESAIPTTRTYCRMLAFTGCSLSEALNMKYSDIDFQQKTITIHNFNDNKRLSERNVPLPDSLLNELQIVHQKMGAELENTNDDKLWNWARTTGYHRIKSIMNKSNIYGYHATSHGLRHSYGIYCVAKGVPLNYIKKWMGHSSYDTTCIYLSVIEYDEQKHARKIWD